MMRYKICDTLAAYDFEGILYTPDHCLALDLITPILHRAGWRWIGEGVHRTVWARPSCRCVIKLDRRLFAYAVYQCAGEVTNYRRWGGFVQDASDGLIRLTPCRLTSPHVEVQDAVDVQYYDNEGLPMPGNVWRVFSRVCAGFADLHSENYTWAKDHAEIFDYACTITPA